MTTASQTDRSSMCALTEDRDWRFIARQPILDRLGHVHAYHLLSRAGDETSFHGDRDEGTKTMIDQATVFGIDLLSDNRLAFIPCTSNSLISGMVDMLPPNMAVLHLEERTPPSQQLEDCLLNFKTRGFRISLGGYAIEPGYEALVALADYVKVDFSRMHGQGLRRLKARVLSSTAALVAERIETQSDYREACHEGFGLFQGFYFCRPELVKNPRPPANFRALHEILKLLDHETLDLDRVSFWVQQDTSLLYRLLRLVNSPVNAVRQEVRRVDAALIIVGEERFRKIVTLALVGGLNAGGTDELLRMSYTRARFAESAAHLCALDPDEQYLLGMTSLIPAMLRIPVERLVQDLPLREEIRAVLCGASNDESILLRWLEAHELGDWAAERTVELAASMDRESVLSLYFSAVQWAEDMLRLAL